MRIEVDIAPGLLDPPPAGRLLVALAAEGCIDPRLSPGPGGPILIGRDVDAPRPGEVFLVDEAAARSVDAIPPGVYSCRAYLLANPDDRALDAPGNLRGPAALAELPGVVRLGLDRRSPPRCIPTDTPRVKHLSIPSPLLSAFHGRPMARDVGVILPRGHDPGRRYPLRVRVGGLGRRASCVHELMDDPRFRRALDDAPPSLLLHLDGGGPLGDPAQVDSPCNGPVGRSVVEELIPLVEREFGGLGHGRHRSLEGESSGGWAALALQIAHPDTFNGAWASSPDPVDFRAFQTIDLYADANLYVDQAGRERPAARDRRGAVAYTVREECRHERTLGLGDRIAASGGQWGSWSSAFGPRVADGWPAPLWDAETGAIDAEVARFWARSDLNRTLEARWADLAPGLAGKLHVGVGDADEYYLDRAVARLAESLRRANPPAGGWVRVGRGRGHCWFPLGDAPLARAIAARIDP